MVKRFRGDTAYTSPDRVVEDHAAHMTLELINHTLAE